MLNGYKTYIIGILIGILAILRYFGVLSQEVFEGTFAILTGGGLAALRAGVAKGK